MANYYASLPYNYLKLLGAPPRYSLVLAPDVISDENFYRRSYDRTRIGNSIYGVIVDSGVVEGLEFTDEMIIEAADIVSATIIILPDVFLDREATLRRIEDFLRKYQNNRVVRNCHLMGVLQGDTPHAVLTCLDELIKMPIQCIGIPYKLSTFISRLDLAQKIKMFSFKQVHYLGMYDIVEDMQDCRMFEGYVDSIDSAVPITMGFNDMQINPSTNIIPPSIRERFLMPNPNLSRALSNINAVSHYCMRMEVK